VSDSQKPEKYENAIQMEIGGSKFPNSGLLGLSLVAEVEKLRVETSNH